MFRLPNRIEVPELTGGGNSSLLNQAAEASPWGGQTGITFVGEAAFLTTGSQPESPAVTVSAALLQVNLKLSTTSAKSNKF